MKRLIILGAVAALAAAPTWATSGGYSIGVNFGADEPQGEGFGTLDPSEVAGVTQALQGNWNNTSGATGSLPGLVADNKGSAVTTGATVEWTSAGTWASQGSRGENNNAFTGSDLKLLTGYLDTGNATTTRVMFTGLPNELTSSGYDVYVYSLGGVSGRGGEFRLEDSGGNPIGDPKLVSAPANPSTYVEDTGASHNEAGTYMIFTAVAGSAVTVVATTESNPLGGTPRAPVNAVQLVARTGEVLPVIRSATGTPCTFQLAVDDLGAAVVNASSIVVKLDGQTVATQNSKTGGSTTISYNLLTAQNQFFVSGSQHTLEISLSDTRGNPVSATRNFTVPTYTRVTAGWKTTNFDASSSGFATKVRQIEVSRGPNENTIPVAEAQLANLIVDANGQPLPDIADQAGADPATGRYVTPTINWERFGFDIDANNPDNFNSFEPENGPRPNDFIPGISGFGSTDNIATESLTCLDLKRGCYCSVS